MPKVRLDQLLLQRGLAPTREKAQALILARQVRVAGQLADKAGKAYDEAAPVEVLETLRYVSRGGLKLEAALQHFAIDPTGYTCIDIGSSTGGFSDCLLQHGATRIYAFDVGTGQLDWKLRNDPRVVVREGVNARYLTKADVPELLDLAVSDVSFISLSLIFPVIPPLLKPHGRFVLLIKPQFEVGREQVGKGGIVRDPALHEQVCEKLQRQFHDAGWHTKLMESPILGAEGNKEFLCYGER